MTSDDDKFALGNFEGVEDLDKITEEVERDLENVEEISREQENGIIKHPTEQLSPQAKFRTKEGEPLLEIPLDLIVPNEFQPRRVFNEERLQELANSIREHGIIQPLVVTIREDGKYEIVVGERRFRAARIAGLPAVPAFVNKTLSAEVKLELAIIENIQRADLNPIEEAKAYERLRDEFHLKVEEIARKVGKDSSTVSNLLRLLNLPVEIQRALIEGFLSEGQARPLLSLKDPNEMLQMYQIVVKNQMKVRDIEAKVREIKKRGIKVAEMYTPDPFIESLESSLRDKLGTKVHVARSAKGGKIMIEFYSDEDLSQIVNKLT